MTRQNNMLENGKYTELVRRAVDKYWRDNCAPPTLLEIMDITGCKSTSHVSKILQILPGMVIVKGKPVPEWVREAIRINGIRISCNELERK